MKHKLKEFTCVSMSRNLDVITDHLQFRIQNKYVPIIQQVETDYIICVDCSIIEFEWIRENMPYGYPCPIKKVIEEKFTPVYYAMPFPKDD